MRDKDPAKEQRDRVNPGVQRMEDMAMTETTRSTGCRLELNGRFARLSIGLRMIAAMAMIATTASLPLQAVCER